MRKLAHIRALGYGLRTWDSARYMIPGVSPSHSVYDSYDSLAHDGTVLPQVHNGIRTERARETLDNPTMTRRGRIGAQYSSLAALPIFQSGWATDWSHMTGTRPVITRTLTMNNNKNAYGKAEMQKATSYNPWPSASDIYPKAV